MMDERVRAHLGKLKQDIIKWLAEIEPPTPAGIEQAKRNLNLLLYLIQPRLGWLTAPAKPIGSPICAHPGCKAGWRESLINYAQSDNDPVWYCAQHGKAPEIGGHMPPGARIELKPQYDRAVEMADRWAAYRAKMAERLKTQTENQHFDWREQ